MNNADAEARLAALRDLLVLDGPADGVYDGAVALAAAICNRPMAAISLSGADQQWLLAELGLDTKQVPREHAFCAQLPDGPGGLEVPDAQRDERFRDNPMVTGDLQIRAYAGVPIVVAGGANVGALCVLDTRPGALSEQQWSSLRTLADLVSETIQTRRMARELAASVAARAAAQQRELTALQDMRMLFEGAPNGLILADREGIVRLANPTLGRLLGLDAGALVGQPYLDIVTDADRDAEAAVLDQMFTSDRSSVVREAHLRRADGSAQVFMLTSMQVRSDDRPPQTIHIRVEDIADRRQAEIGLLESQSALDGIVTVDQHERIVSWNEGAVRLLGHDRLAALGKPLSIIVPPYAREAHAHGFARLVGGAEPVLLGKTVELEALTADGTLLPIELSLSRWYRGGDPFFTAVIRDISERRRHEAEQQWHATHDATSGLGNLSLLREWFEHECPTDHAHPRAVLSLQLTSLNEVTTALGADVAEQVLRRIGESFREEIGDDVFICHLGDSHFAGSVRLEPDPHPASLAERLTAVARFAIDVASGPFTIEGIPVEMRVQVGIIATRQPDVSFTELLRQAEATRVSTPRRINVADEVVAPDGNDSADLVLLSELRAGVARGELELHYQPVVDLQDHSRARPDDTSMPSSPFRVEALVRWRHPVHGLVPPGHFIPLIETGPLISTVTRWVLNEALMQHGRWRDEGLNVIVAVNLSPHVLLNDDAVTMITSALDETGADPTALKVEITESAIVADPDEVRDIVLSLRRLGTAVSLDDFGTGYTSLRLLRDLPVDEIKLDRLFVADATTNPADAAIANAVAQLAQRLGIRTVAEGVEDTETRSLFRALGYDYLQGYLEARPLPVDAATSWLRAAAGINAERTGPLALGQPGVPHLDITSS